MKRGTMLLAGVASLLPAQLGPVLAHAAPHELSPSFEPPTTPLVLTRTLWRSNAPRRWPIRSLSARAWKTRAAP